MSHSKTMLAAAAAVFAQYSTATAVLVTSDGNAFLVEHKNLAENHARQAKLEAPVRIEREELEGGKSGAKAAADKAAADKAAADEKAAADKAAADEKAAADKAAADKAAADEKAAGEQGAADPATGGKAAKEKGKGK